jgi:hypothetical protein
VKWIAVQYIFWSLVALLLEAYRRSPFVVIPSLLIWPFSFALLILDAPQVKRCIIEETEEEIAWNTARNYRPGWASRKKLALVHKLR